MTELQKLAAQVSAALIGGSVSPYQRPANQCSDPMMDAFCGTYHKVYAFLQRIEKDKD